MLGVGDGAGDNGVCRLGRQSLTANMRPGDELSAYRPGCRGNPISKVSANGLLDLAGWPLCAKGSARRLVSSTCFASYVALIDESLTQSRAVASGTIRGLRARQRHRTPGQAVSTRYNGLQGRQSGRLWTAAGGPVRQCRMGA